VTRARGPTEGPPGSEVRVGVAVPAAGSGARMGGARKPFLELAGEPILLHALRPLLADPRVVSVVVALAPDEAADPPAWLAALHPRVSVVAGGSTRGASVGSALLALPKDLDVIAVHDAARPLVEEEVVRRCLDAAAAGVGAVAGCPAIDTLKRVDAEAFVRDTPDRATIWHAHTPQAFPAVALRKAYASGSVAETDDSALVELAGGRVRMIDDGGSNLKVTHPEDLVIAEAVLRARSRA
jgi:2-C-methyl-D-erythritol 4-phosphate cytidylyltransferase